jgi:hypothetical protein
MKEKILKDLLIILNGAAVGMLAFSRPNIDVIDVGMVILAGLTFFWYGKIEK